MRNKYVARKQSFDYCLSYYYFCVIRERKQIDNPQKWYKFFFSMKSQLKIQIDKILRKYQSKIKVVKRVLEKSQTSTATE